MIHIAQTYFTFLTRSPATTALVEGDARLALAQEAAQHFDLLVLDAFRGDAIWPYLRLPDLDCYLEAGRRRGARFPRAP